MIKYDPESGLHFIGPIGWEFSRMTSLGSWWQFSIGLRIDKYGWGFHIDCFNWLFKLVWGEHEEE